MGAQNPFNQRDQAEPEQQHGEPKPQPPDVASSEPTNQRRIENTASALKTTIGVLVAFLYGLSGLPKPNSVHDGHVAEALRLSKTAPQR